MRPTHRAVPRPQRDWRTRKDPFDSVWLIVLAWLQAEPARTATELLVRLQTQHPGEYPDANLRTLQRRIKLWRRAAASKLLFAKDTVFDATGDLTLGASAATSALPGVQHGPTGARAH